MAKNLKALVVDDDPVMRMIITKELASIGIQSQTAENGSEAILKLKDFNADFVLMDIQMPEQDGLDATRWIRELPIAQIKDTLIFALTSFGLPEHTKELMAAGFNEHFVKPFDLNRLREVLKKYFKDF